MSCLASKCLAQFVRWQIKCDGGKSKNLGKKNVNIIGSNYPVIKIIMRNVWNLVANRKAREGLILLLVELLREIHRETHLLKLYYL